MSFRSPLLLSALALGLLTGCTSSAGLGPGGNGALVSVQATYQKEVLAPNGSHTMTSLPARYCYVEFRDASNNAVLGDSGYLDGAGQGTFRVPAGSSVYAKVYADWAVPGDGAGAPDVMRGYTVNAPYGTDFNQTVDWAVTSASFTATDGSLTVQALDDGNHIAGAFAIADQGVTFALGLRGVAPTATLPTLAMYWSTSTSSADQARAYPAAVFSGANIVTVDGRALFEASVYGNPAHVANTEEDQWDDGTLGETYAHLLFAPYSYKADGSSSLSWLRSDTENVPFLSLAGPSEPSQAFIAGFSDFLSAAFRNDPRILDSYYDGGGVLRVQDEDLSVPDNTLGEFSRYGVAGSLWSMWQGALGGGSTGLQSLFQEASAGPRPALDAVGDYLGAPLGCYPTYLVGLRADTGSAWNNCLPALTAWGVSNPSALYFSATTLWTNEPGSFTASGTLQLPASPAYLAECYDRDGAALYRFTQGSTATRTFTLTPNGQDMELDLIGPNGPVVFDYQAPYGFQRQFQSTLSPGDYVIRVRANPDNTLTHTAGTYGFTLSLN